MSFNTIAFFQFDNLIRNRVPLMLILLDNIDLTPWYNSIVKMHLEVITHRLKANQVLSYVKEQKADLQFGILVLDTDGKHSPAVVESLEQAGYLNAFYVSGGFNQLLTEKGQNPN